MVSPFVKAELTAAVSSLGFLDGGKYFKDQYCLEALKDLIRYLRRDNDTLIGIRRELGEMKLVQTNLIPILCEYQKDEQLFDVTLRLLVNLTNPTLLLFNEELPKEKEARNYYLQHVSHLQSYKPCLSSEKLWMVLTDKLKLLLVKEPEDRLEDDKLLTERILIFIRNILDIPPTPEDEKRTDDDASIHDQVLWSMHLSGMEDVVIYLASNDNERHFCMHVMEIISLMLREQDATTLATAAAERSLAEQQKETDDLVAIVAKEASEREARYKKMTASRSSIFRGTFCVKDVKSITEKELIVHRSAPDVKTIDFHQNKKAKRKSTRNLPLPSSNATRRSTLSIRLMLKEFCLQILNGAYNSLMHIVKDCLVRMKAQDHDETYYLWALKFFMEFNRHANFRVELVSETVSIGLFHYIQTLVDNYSELIRVDKTKFALWSRRLHVALRAYQELLLTLGSMDKHPSETVRKSSEILQRNVFYVPEYREMSLILLKAYKETQHSLDYLKDLIETTHIFLKLFQQHSKTNRHVIIKTKNRTQKKRKKKAKKAVETENSDQRNENVTPSPPPTFEEIAAEISAALQENPSLPEGLSPYDAVSDLSNDDQKIIAMGMIQKCLKELKMDTAVALLRSSREFWPEGEVFGSLEIRPEEELLLLRTLFYSDLPDVEQVKQPDKSTDAMLNSQEEEEDEDEGDSGAEEIEEEEMAAVNTKEQELQFDDFVHRFAHCKIVQAYCLLLRRYDTNTALTNHCIVKMLHRVAFDSKLPAMLFQASLFITFRKIMADPRSKSDPTIKELSKFAVYIVRKFTHVARTNRKVFAELLFWKTAREAADIELGYDSNNTESKKGGSNWSEEEEDELQRLHQEFKDIQDPERDIVDRVMDNMINRDRSRRSVIRKMKELGLIHGAKDLARTKTSIKVRPPKEWADHEVVELRRLFEEVRGSSDPLSLLIDRMPIRRAKRRIRDKIVELGLVNDVKELRKKRPSNKKNKSKRPDPLAENNNDEDEDDRILFQDRHRSFDDSDDDSSDSDDNSSDGEGGEAGREPGHGAVRSTNRPYGFMRENVEAFNAEKLAGPLALMMDGGRKEGLSWLCECLRETRQDRLDDGGDEAIPLLPLSEPSIDAMEDHNFLNFIAKLGLAPPANEQEQYWRIPSALDLDALQLRIDFLQAALKDEDKSPTGVEDSGSTKRAAEQLFRPESHHKRRRIVQSDSSSSDSEVEPTQQHGEEQPQKQQVDEEKIEGESVAENLATMASSDDESLEPTRKSTAASTSRKRITVLDSSSDSE